MGFKINTGGSGKDSQDYKDKDVVTQKDEVFVRDDTDNKLFTSIQLKDISKIINDQTIGAYDADTLMFTAASNVETKFVTVRNKKDKSITEQLKNITTFKGAGKKIGANSWLGLQNVDRELQGLDPWCVDDFEVEAGQALKYDHAKSLEQAKMQVYLKLKQVRLQFGIPTIKVILGEGDNFRHELDLCRPYKGQRSAALRPLLLKEIREWAVSELSAEMAKPRWDGQNVEADDTCEYYGSLGYSSYRKTGVFSYLVIASDKDAQGNPKLLVNPDTHVGKDNPLKGKFKFPQAMLIDAADRSAGDLELVVKTSSSDVKGYGFKFIMYQALLGGDGADNYNALSHLGQKLDFGDKAAYQALKPCNTAKECLQKAIDVYAELLPYGVQYTTHDGRELNVDCMTYMDTYFKVAYMLKSEKDKTDFYKVCEGLKVDTTSIENNHKKVPPKRTYVGNEEVTVEFDKYFKDLLQGDLKAYKSLKKGDLVEIIDNIKAYVNLRWEIEDHYAMVTGVEAEPIIIDTLQKAIDARYLDGEPRSEEADYEVFLTALSEDIVHEETEAEHRWYDVRDVVHQVTLNGVVRFFRTFDYHTTGDGCARDMDLEMPTMKDVHEVFSTPTIVNVYK